MKITKQGNIKAPIEVVFRFMTDIELYREEIVKGFKGQSVKLNYDRNKPFGVGNKIVCSMEKPVILMTITKNDSPYHLSMNIEPNKRYLDLFGTIKYDGTLEELNEKAIKYTFTYESNKNPKGFLKFIILCCFHVSFYFTNKRIKKRITRSLKEDSVTAAP